MAKGLQNGMYWSTRKAPSLSSNMWCNWVPLFWWDLAKAHRSQFFIPEKTNIFPENQRLENAFPVKLSRFRDMLIFGGVNLIKFPYTNLIFGLLAVNLAVQSADRAGQRRWQQARRQTGKFHLANCIWDHRYRYDIDMHVHIIFP